MLEYHPEVRLSVAYQMEMSLLVLYIHTHVLPVIDDDPRTMEEVIETVSALVEEALTRGSASTINGDPYRIASVI